ncbi:tRNA (adenosine(37)-N6)-threonylcarbamoyltransferase complex ATPase subunit type 1 TsaE [Caulobacter sp. S45]|uniref:tRNA (adenosine(37)-N6)-threonylcarbamoyltransferase complex ATPase subunit type 1 TsaE n=1 Tax=Caulobacter sp. S45 TaxID=1641861 RepID=UPI001576A218|nr:tRNA (adenosine(37)-N6)-threonylcarbamoyltransferase complex ATPase subunit type 1 TsaE [Caulobacter sp. S45]
MQALERDSSHRRFDSPQALEAFGAQVAQALGAGEAVCLFGPLGAGKSTLARGLVRALTRPDQDVPSPTFTLMQTYQGPNFPLAHLDLYRLKRPEEAFEIGLDEALDVGAAVVEWSERLDGALPPDRLDVRLEIADDGGRIATLRGHGVWTGREHDLLRPARD